MRLVYRVHAWIQSEKGQSMIEYGLVIGLIAVGLILALANFKTELAALFTRLQNAIHNIAQ